MIGMKNGKQIDAVNPALPTLKILLLGAGNSYTLHVTPEDKLDHPREILRLDLDPLCKPDVMFDLARLHGPDCYGIGEDGEPIEHWNQLPFPDNHFDEIHAYEILEHFGRPGDWRGFFAEWSEYYRVMKPGAYFCGSVPWWRSQWAYGDPGHTRTIQPELFVFLSQAQYSKQVGITPMTDYRAVWQGDFEFRGSNAGPEGPPGDRMFFMLQRGALPMTRVHDFGPERDARRAER